MNPLLLSDEKLDECEQKKLQQLLDVIYLINDNDGRKWARLYVECQLGHLFRL